jgi:fatty-acyl-CoA synthase
VSPIPSSLWPATDLLRERARLTPGKTALVDVASGERFTYGDLDRRASAWARLLRRDLGLARGDRYGVLAHNAPEVIELFFTAGRAGLVVVPLNGKAPARELAEIVEDCGVRVVVHGPDHGDTARELAELAGGDLRLAGFGDRPAPRSDDDGGFPPDPQAPEDVYCLLYTSGTTGRPKGVMLSQRMILANAVNTVLSWQLRDSDISPIFTPLYHAGGLAVFLTPLVAAGGTLVLHRAFDAEEVWRTLADEGCTVVLGVPTIYRMLLEAPVFAAGGLDLSSVRWLISGGAPLPPELVAEYDRHGLTLKQGYGLTEVGVNCFFMTEEEALTHAGAIGRPMLFTEARLLRADGTAVAPGAVDEVGELCLRGPHVSSGYWNRPEATAEAYDGEGFFHTGDLARRDADGLYWIAGRRKEMFVSGGANVYPAEVELALATHDGVADVAVVGVPHPKWGEVGVAFWVPAPGAAEDEEALRAHVGERLARYKVPYAFVVLEGLPRTPYGKVVKGDLAELWRARQGSDGASSGAPSSGVGSIP